MWLWTEGVNTNRAAAKVMNLTFWGKRYALALLGRYKQVSGSAQKVPLSKNLSLAVTPLVLAPSVPFRAGAFYSKGFHYIVN